MRKRKGQSDADICMAISGNGDMDHAGGLRVVEDYFLREYEENRRAQGLDNVYQVPMADGGTIEMSFNPDTGRSQAEIALWLHEKNLSEIEQARTNREDMEYPQDWENDCTPIVLDGQLVFRPLGLSLPKPRVTETV